MKKYYTAIRLLVLLGVVGSLIILVLSPDVIPLHYNFKGEIDRWGSKYENLLFPAAAILLGALFMLTAKGQRRKPEASNEKTMLIAAIVTVAFFDALIFFLGIKAMRSAGDRNAAAPGIGTFMGIALGALFCLLGNIMPKARNNSMFGLRTKWSRYHDRVWQKSQRFAGFASVILGLLLIAASAFLSDMWILFTIVAASTTWLALCILASRHYYMEDIKTYGKEEHLK